MSLVGKQIEEFKAQAYQKGEFIDVTDADIKGHWSVIMFYPADFSFVCPTELEDLQDQYQTLQSLGVEVYSVSEDTHFVHKAWHDESDAVGKLQYAMIGDPSHQLAKMFDVFDEDAGLAQRGTFILDKDGVFNQWKLTLTALAGTLLNTSTASKLVNTLPLIRVKYVLLSGRKVPKP